jgi:hypothetical protein
MKKPPKPLKTTLASRPPSPGCWRLQRTGSYWIPRHLPRRGCERSTATDWSATQSIMLLYTPPRVLSTEERELARYPFKPKLNKTPRPSTTPFRPKPLTSEERILASYPFSPKLNSNTKALWQLQAESIIQAPRIIRPALVHGEHSVSAEELIMISKLKAPHNLLMRVFDMVFIILEEPYAGTWHHTLYHLADPYKFLTSVKKIRKEAISKQTLELLQPYLVPNALYSASDLSLAHARRLFPDFPGVCLLLDWVLYMADKTPMAWRQASWSWWAEPPLPWKVSVMPPGVAHVEGTSTWWPPSGRA